MTAIVLLFSAYWKAYWKPIGIILVILAVFYAGYHVRGTLDQIASDKALQAQIEANKQAQDELNAKSAKVEADLAMERLKSSDLQKRWSRINAQKHAVCSLSNDVRGLLHDASINKDANSR